ncbi:MAG: HD domain-containing protein [Selenomonadaceae bacterium]|nr:HD domain-containing protein [Selenomonadaceae bacterium]
MTRAGQFFRAVFAKITDEDKDYAKKYLNDKGESLFFAMAEFDQAHALAVARTIEKFEYSGEREFLVRLALLHDVGRRKADSSVFGKVFAVLINGFSKKIGRYLSKYFRFLYIYYNHPQIGAKLLTEAGFVKEAEIIRLHHESVLNQSKELSLLKKADEMN